jgi:hypothetical protein
MKTAMAALIEATPRAFPESETIRRRIRASMRASQLTCEVRPKGIAHANKSTRQC